MGLDMFAYSLDAQGKRDGLQYWRKHPDLHGWMERKWRERGCLDHEGKPVVNQPGFGNEPVFNCVPVELHKDDIDELERAVVRHELPYTTGFFFGQSDPTDYERDLDFLLKARQALAEGKRVFYDSWW